jgi:tRNA 2-thiouridine synthesizing protein E
MNQIASKGKIYYVNAQGFLLDSNEWDDDFAAGMAEYAEIRTELTEEHWKVIRYLRKALQESGKCPLVYQTCKDNELSLLDLKRLFPTGYLRGACKLAGLSYNDEFSSMIRNGQDAPNHQPYRRVAKNYQVTARGFLLDPFDWDENFAIGKAQELGMNATFRETHWQIIRYLRDYYLNHHVVPTIYQVCEAHAIGLEEMERLFPVGYHRGALKIAGLHD